MEIRFISHSAAIEHATGAAISAFVGKDGLDREIPAALEGARECLERAAAADRFTGAAGQVLTLLAPTNQLASRLVLIGTGDTSHAGASIDAGARAYAASINANHETLVIIANGDHDPVDVAEGVGMRSYRFDKYRTKEPASKKPVVNTVLIACNDPVETAARYNERREVLLGAFLTRDLVSEPSNILHPESYAELLCDLRDLGVDVEVLGEAEMSRLGMGALLGVGQGSVRESKMVIMRWNGAGDDSAPVAFVGKGVTFDTGGISIKPSEGMEQMKWDMGGSAIVAGTMRALAGRKAKVNAVGIVGLVENMPDGNAQRPGDVVTSMSGQTIEVLNTDAEGRLVLADCLWYCKEECKPKWIIDLATLTGAIIVALGHEYAGFFTDSDDLSGHLQAAADATGEKVWRMPLHSNYDKMINTPTADMKNIGGRAAGSITAAQFLKRFVGDTPWAHIDVAGTVWDDKDGTRWEKGATGYGVRLLDRLVADTEES